MEIELPQGLLHRVILAKWMTFSLERMSAEVFLRY